MHRFFANIYNIIYIYMTCSFKILNVGDALKENKGVEHT